MAYAVKVISSGEHISEADRSLANHIAAMPRYLNAVTDLL
jgi:hypothetical protein